jgi:hypothetical protein
MARGWESKNIESQQEEAARSRKKSDSLTPEQQEQLAKRHTLELARARAAADLDAATAPAHRRMLESAIAALDEQLKSLI